MAVSFDGLGNRKDHMRFAKLREASGDHWCLDCVGQPLPANLGELHRQLTSQGRCAALDRVILLCAAERADVRLRLCAADGNEADAEGNGLAAAARMAHDWGLARAPSLLLETVHGLIPVALEVKNNRVERVRVDLGKPVLKAEKIPTTLPGNPPVEVPITFPDTMHNLTCLGMLGSPHCAVFIRDVNETLVDDLGPRLERHPGFPQGTSVEFVKINRRDDVTVLAWVRGRGRVPASVAAASAVAVAGPLSGRTGRSLAVRMPGGTLAVEWSTREDDHVFLATSVDIVEEREG